jgi:hypothetical protein
VGIEIDCHDAIVSYLKFYGSVDRADRGISDYTISRRSGRWYTRVAFWVFDALLWNLWNLAKYHIEAGDEDYQRFDEKKYKGTISGRYRFQLEVAKILMEHGEAGALAAVSGCRREVRWLKALSAGDKEKEKGGKKGHYIKKIRKHTAPCIMCYEKTDPSLTRAQRRALCKRTDEGCTICDKLMCDECFISHHSIRQFPISPTTRELLIKRWLAEQHSS